MKHPISNYIEEQVEDKLLDKFVGQHNATSNILKCSCKSVWYHVECNMSDEIYDITQRQIAVQIQNIMHNTFKGKL